MVKHSLALAVLASLTLAGALPAPEPPVELVDRAISNYQPIPATCPSGSLVRPAKGINAKEQKYVTARKAVADAALASWLKKQCADFCTSSLPIVGLTSSGGGYRSLLESAGVVQGFDIRDTNATTGGVYQGLTYQAGLSGGSWFLSSLAGNDWPTVTYLKTTLWEQAFAVSLLLPANLLSTSGATEYAVISTEIAAKESAGYDTTIVDPYGRLLSYQLLAEKHGGSGVRLSGLTGFSNFTSHNVPYPIITATGVLFSEGQCLPPLNATIYEFHPYEYGSWDQGVSAFANTKYMGSDLSNGKPANLTCTVHYDNIGYIFGTSSDVFNALCEAVPAGNSSTDSLPSVLEGLLPHDPEEDDLLGIYPNPFYQYPRSSLVSNDKELTLADGGETLQNNPIWPYIQPARSVDVLIVNDNSADTSDNFPNGTEILQTYLRAQAVGLPKMPFIPPVATFVSEGLNKRATFFGCNQTSTVLMVYMPNVNYTYPSNQPTSKLQYAPAETDGMIANGVAIATQNGVSDWPLCLACAIMIRSADLPSECTACFDKYCYRQ